jgi:PAS domain-containing protein
MRQIGSSIVAALISMLDADFVFIALPGQGNQPITELARSNLTPESLDHVRSMLQRENATLGIGREFIFADPSVGRGLHVVTAPIGFGGDAILAAGSVRDTFPTRTEKLLLNTGANQAAIAFQQWLGDAEKRRFTALVQRTTDFVGITSLRGQFQYVNPAGLESVGLATLDDALRLHVLDFILPRDRKTRENSISGILDRGANILPDRLVQDRRSANRGADERRNGRPRSQRAKKIRSRAASSK